MSSQPDVEASAVQREGTSVEGSVAPRLLIGLGGVALIGVGLIEALGLGFVDLLWLAGWLAAGVFAHDVVIAPGTAALSKLAADRWHVRVRRIPAVAIVCTGSLTLIALPLLGRQGSVAGNPTLLGRNYLAGWASACLLVLIGAFLAEWFRRVLANRHRRDGRRHPQDSTGPPAASTGAEIGAPE